MSSRVALTTAALLALIAAPARAEIPNLSLDLGLTAGGNLVLDQWDVGELDANQLWLTPGHGGVIKGRVGFTPWRWLSLELGVGMVVAPSRHLNAIAQYELDLLLQPFDFDRLTPFFDVGGGAYHNLTADIGGTDLDPQVHWGLGVRYLLLDWLALRAEARHVISDGQPEGLLGVSSNLELMVGADFFVWVQDQDLDDDGILDADDACPDRAGLASLRGCPDRDRDGILDDEDKCPEEAGPAERQGCPARDHDGDGLIDGQDKCPTEPGPTENSGCPWGDADGDGLADNVDQCPAEAGPQPNGGCPWGDRDQDGLTDDVDQCPDQVGPAANNGCPEPDRDGDGIIDKLDNCPDQAGTQENSGCQAKQLVVLTAEKIEILDKVYFAFNRAVIEKRSNALLDNVAAVINAHPEIVRIRIEGHTDAVGNAEYNRKLSQQRADAVKDYLVKKGIAPDRLGAVGFGPDKPLETNNTKEGRAKNRRVEFNIVQR